MTHQVLRMAALERDGHRCTDCGREQSLEIHHVIPLRLGGDDLLENLRTLCKKCHRRHEPHEMQAMRRKSVSIDVDLYDYVTGKAERYHESFSTILRRLLKIR